MVNPIAIQLMRELFLRYIPADYNCDFCIDIPCKDTLTTIRGDDKLNCKETPFAASFRAYFKKTY